MPDHHLYSSESLEVANVLHYLHNPTETIVT